MVYVIDPLRDQRWDSLVERHPRAAAFHGRGWLLALHRTYGYEPVAFTTTPPGRELRDALVFCAVRSWLTGRRLVSLPFADHCDPLVDGPEGLDVVWAAVRRRAKRDGWRYVEMRPLSLTPFSGDGLAAVETYAWHRLDLRQAPERLWQSLHPDCIRRKIRRATREGLAYDEGRSPALVAALHELVHQTRRRHGLPPAPKLWLVHLVAALGDDVTIRIARKDGRPVAGILTVRSGHRVLYKYGGSDAAFHPAGGMQALIWRAIEAARAAGAEALDLGRSDPGQRGLLAFKERWGATRSAVTYYRYPARLHVNRRGLGVVRPVFARMPARLLDLAGRLLYRHVG